MRISKLINRMSSGGLGLLLGFLAGAVALQAQVSLPDYVVSGSRVANQAATGSLDMPVTALRFDPRIDLQGRGTVEAQADVAIRGGHFESTGFRVGAAPLADAQTGHYSAEIPVPPSMLTGPTVSTGADLAAGGFNASAGSIAFGWRPVQDAVVASASAGQYALNRQSLYVARTRAAGAGTLAGDIEWARSEGDGSRPGGDHLFSRIAARAQLRAGDAQTDLFLGYQDKFFGWPNLYTPFGFNETESLQTTLVLVNHERRDAAGNRFAASAFFRRNKDDYEFNRAVPGASNPFQHTTVTRGVSAQGRIARFAGGALDYSLDATADRLDSTALTFGDYMSRRIFRASLLPRWEWAAPRGTVGARAGAVLEDSNREGGALAPIVALDWRVDGLTAYLEYSGASQLPSYTALNSSAASGLFRGNRTLARSESRNLEAGLRGRLGGWSVETALFRREDDRLVDWVFRRGVTARAASAVDVETVGFEWIASRRTGRVEVVAGYAWLRKEGVYDAGAGDGSFYALNFPRHRLTLALTLELAPGLELRSDNEYRVQEPNPLRTAGGERAWLSAAGLYARWRTLPGWEFSVLVDNLAGSDFQEVPAVPAGRRQWSVGASRRW